MAAARLAAGKGGDAAASVADLTSSLPTNEIRRTQSQETQCGLVSSNTSASGQRPRWLGSRAGENSRSELERKR